MTDDLRLDVDSNASNVLKLFKTLYHIIKFVNFNYLDRLKQLQIKHI